MPVRLCFCSPFRKGTLDGSFCPSPKQRGNKGLVPKHSAEMSNSKMGYAQEGPAPKRPKSKSKDFLASEE